MYPLITLCGRLNMAKLHSLMNEPINIGEKNHTINDINFAIHIIETSNHL